MTIDGINTKLDSICEQLNNNSFYIGFRNYTNIKKSISCKDIECMDGIFDLNSSYRLINPALESTTLFKVKPNVFKAFPIHLASTDFLRYYQKFDRYSSFCGIALVSHKLKIFSFSYACYNASLDDKLSTRGLNDDYVALLLGGTGKLYAWCKYLNINDYQLPSFVLHQSYASYKPLHTWQWRTLKLNSSIIPFDICLSIEDHWNTELMLEAIQTSNMLKDIDVDMQHLSNSMATCVNRRNAALNKFSQYELDMYKCKIDADLNN